MELLEGVITQMSPQGVPDSRCHSTAEPFPRPFPRGRVRALRTASPDDRGPQRARAGSGRREGRGCAHRSPPIDGRPRGRSVERLPANRSQGQGGGVLPRGDTRVLDRERRGPGRGGLHRPRSGRGCLSSGTNGSEDGHPHVRDVAAAVVPTSPTSSPERQRLRAETEGLSGSKNRSRRSAAWRMPIRVVTSMRRGAEPSRRVSRASGEKRYRPLSRASSPRKRQSLPGPSTDVRRVVAQRLDGADEHAARVRRADPPPGSGSGACHR